MKAKIIYSLVFIFTLTIVYSFRNAGNTSSASYMPPAVQSSFLDSFFIGVLEVGAEQNYSTYVPLGINLWSKYTKSTNAGWTDYAPGDTLNAPLSNYQTDVNTLLSNNNSHNMRTLMDRIKIQYLAYGQRSDYKCANAFTTGERWFYSYTTHTAGTDVPDSGTTVRYCTGNPSNPGIYEGWAAKDLKANREQVNTKSFSYYFMIDSLYRWYVKPRIRIDSAFANNPTNWNVKVCRVDILNFNGNIIDSLSILVKNFLDLNNSYYGQYKEEFRYLPGQDSLAFGPGGILNPEHKEPDDMSCEVDYRVWFYGNCSMWLDYVRVDNDVADNLFGTGQTHNLYMDWLYWEAHDLALSHSSPLNFYIEEFEFNCTPCMKYVNEKIITNSGGKFSLTCDLNSGEYALHQPNYGYHLFHADFIKRNLIEDLGLREILSFVYPFNAYYHNMTYGWNTPSYIPSTFGVTYDSVNGIAADSISPAAYDTWLQSYFDYQTFPSDYHFTAKMKLIDSVSKIADVPFINMVQVHLANEGGYKSREPTNEEIKLMVNLSLTYGAKGILYFWYGSWGGMGTGSYSRGLTDYPGLSPRYTNVYGERKWDTIAAINRKLKKWGPYLMTFDNTNRHNCIYRLQGERYTFENSTYFRSVASYKPGGDDPICGLDMPDASSRLTDGLTFECPEDNYVQAATFNTIPGNTTQYFMIVNRRCSPYLDETTEDRRGGRRLIRVWFDSASAYFPNPHNSWRIVDLGNDRVEPIRFNKHTPNKISLDWFQPGEGKLYKIEPVITEGGILESDEVINGNIIIEDTVYTNGYNITVENNSGIQFTDSSCFVIQGGSFTMGNSLYNGVPNISVGASSGNSWSGFVFDSCEVRIYNSTFSGFGRGAYILLPAAVILSLRGYSK